MIELEEGMVEKLVNAGVGKYPASTTIDTKDWVITYGKLAAEPMAVVNIRVTAGQTANPKFLLDYPAAQCLIRGHKGKYTEAKKIAYRVKDILLGITSQTVKGIHWVAITMQGDVLYLGNDENDCPMFSVNFQCIIEPPTNSDTNRIPL